jgi:hypothetical protein
MSTAGGPGRIPALLFLAIVIVAIAALLAGYGIPVGVGALAGLVLGAMAGAIGTLWLSRGTGRSIHLGGVAWDSSEALQPASAGLVTPMEEFVDVLASDLGRTRSIQPVMTTTQAPGLEVELVAIEVREAGAMLIVEVRVLPGGFQPPPIVQVGVTDDIGTAYRAVGQAQGGSPNRSRFGITVIPVTPPLARELTIRIDRFVDMVPVGRRAAIGPWSFTVVLRPASGETEVS